MSRQAIAAALARDDLSSGERLVAFSLASFADRENRARPGTPAAAARAGLRKSRFLEARDGLVRRELVVVEHAARGRGRASTLALPFAESGPWWEGDINAELFEAVLGYSRAPGPARLLLAAAAAVADERRVVDGMTTGQLCAAAGVADRTYRRARAALLASGDLILRRGTGGRGNTNCWEIPDPRLRPVGVNPAGGRRVAPPPGARPLVATVVARPAVDEGGCKTIADRVDDEAEGALVGAGQGGQDSVSLQDRPDLTVVSSAKDGQDRRLRAQNRPIVTGVSVSKGGQDRTVPEPNRPAVTGVSVSKGGQDRTVSRQRAAETPAETPAPYVRAGSEPQNPRTHPPSPPEGGSGDSILVAETFVSERGRKRRRLVPVDLAAVRAQLATVTPPDRAAWEQVRGLLLEAVGESTFAIWLEPLELIAIDRNRVLVVSAPPQTDAWIRDRFGSLIARCAERAARELRICDERERAAVEPSARGARTSAHLSSGQSSTVSHDTSSDSRSGRSSRQSSYTSTYTHVYNQAKEVS
jgi:hypothetical protein